MAIGLGLGIVATACYSRSVEGLLSITRLLSSQSALTGVAPIHGIAEILIVCCQKCKVNFLSRVLYKWTVWKGGRG